MNVHGGVVDVGASLVRMGWRPLGLLVPLPPLPPPAPQKSRRMMAYNNIDFGFNPVGASTCVRKQEVGKPSVNAAQPSAKAEGCVHDDPPRADKLGDQVNWWRHCRRGGWMWHVSYKLGGEVLDVGSLVL